MHLPLTFTQLVVMPVSAGLFAWFPMTLVHRVCRRIARSNSQGLVMPPPSSGQINILVVAAWLVTVGIYLWLIPGNKLMALQGLAVGDGMIFVLWAMMFGLLAVLGVLFPGRPN